MLYEIFCKIIRKHQQWRHFLRAWALLKKWLQSTCFTVNFNKLFRQLFCITPSNGCFIILGKLNKNNFNQRVAFPLSTLTNFSKGSFILYVHKISQKTNISYPLPRTRMCAWQGVNNVGFPENFVYVLNENRVAVHSSLFDAIHRFFFSKFTKEFKARQ